MLNYFHPAIWHLGTFYFLLINRDKYIIIINFLLLRLSSSMELQYVYRKECVLTEATA